MIPKIQLQKDARILAGNGRQVGSLERVVVYPSSKVLTNIVVRTGSLINHHEKVVPIDMVAETAHGLVVLRDGVNDLEAMPSFEERRVVDEKGTLDRPPQDEPPAVYGFPGVGPAVVPEASEQFVTQIEQNIPDGTVAMKEGAHVITAEGKQVGNVESVVADPSVEQVTHLLVSTGLLTKVMKLIPVQWVVTFGEDNVHLRVAHDEVEELDQAPLAV